MRLKLGILDAEVTNFFRKLVKDVMALRKTTNTDRKDFMQLLIELKEKGSVSDNDGIVKSDCEVATIIIKGRTIFEPIVPFQNSSLEFSDDDLAAQATVFFLAGFETSSSVLSFALLELAANPDVQTKAHQEIDEAFSESEESITYEKLVDLKYLSCILQGNIYIFLGANFLI
jgi:cytochrome P450 family 6